jgi:hypothetical protein
MVKQKLDVFNHLFCLAVVEDPLHAPHKLMLPGFLIEADVVMKVFHQGVGHRWVIFA